MKILINLISNMLDPIIEVIIFITFIAALMFGIIFVIIGRREKKDGRYNPVKLRAGRTIVIVSSSFLVALTILSFFLHGGFGSLGIFLLFLTPIIIIAGLILTLSLGLYLVVAGHSNPKNQTLIQRGWVLLIINFSLVFIIITLFILFATGAIPIRLM